MDSMDSMNVPDARPPVDADPPGKDTAMAIAASTSLDLSKDDPARAIMSEYCMSHVERSRGGLCRLRRHRRLAAPVALVSGFSGLAAARAMIGGR
jgi:hypothetical protein